ncbi:MAG: recombination regulator RecX [Rhodocyclales bacterium CG_4_10_14_3_um_filter_68_10]|nr:MAG: recombination regulator RecX [Rhodocyclales bacterium CG_4_10_14_3_um_filter_68_10]
MSVGLRERALRLLARREHSRAELARKLAGGAEPVELDAVLDRLEREGYLSDRRFAEAYVTSHGARHGIARLHHDLRRRGVSDALIGEAVGTLAQTEIERAREVWKRHFGRAPDNPREYARQARFFEARGFGSEVLRALLKSPGT